MIIFSNIKESDKTILSGDDRTFCATLQLIAEKYGSDFELAFAVTGNQNNDMISERPICEEVEFGLFWDGLGDKLLSNSWLLRN